VAARRIQRFLSRLKSRTPSALLASIIDTWRRDLTSEQFSARRPLAAAALRQSGRRDHRRSRGAITLARIRRDLTPFDALVRELGPLLDAAARLHGPARSGIRMAVTFRGS
jgi:hypothetical protein